MSNRIVRINELVQREINDILRRRYTAEAVAITVSEVRVAPDLRDGRVFVAILGEPGEVADHPSAERDDERFAFQPLRREQVIAGMDCFQAFGGFAGGNNDERRGKAGVDQ